MKLIKKYHYFFYLDMKELKDSGYKLYNNASVPGNGVVRVGDLELDGNLGLAITMTNGSDPKTFFFRNLDCKQAFADGKINPSTSGRSEVYKCRFFEKRESTQVMISERTTYLASFFDFGEIGYPTLTKVLQLPYCREWRDSTEAAGQSLLQLYQF
jgi:hypothetical protein